MTSRRTLVAVTVAVLLGGAAALVVAQSNFDKVEIKTDKLGDNVYVLYGAGGNIGLCAGADGNVLIDDQFAPLSEKILWKEFHAGETIVVDSIDDEIVFRAIEGIEPPPVELAGSGSEG